MKIGSLFSGYGGLDMAVAEHFRAQLAWYAEIDKAPSKVMAHHHPGVPNLGDVTKIDWNSVPKIDILTGGYPCQPFSTAGLRKGSNDERHLWPYVATAISVLRPQHVVLENVRGHITLGGAAVIAELAGMGYDARWGLVRASDAGAAHQRTRLFIVADSDSYARSESQRANRDVPRPAGTIFNETNRKIVRYSDSISTDADGNRCETRDGESGSSLTERPGHTWPGFGPYSRAIERWECITRNCPNPIDENDRLTTVFVEWLMGLPEGWVTGLDIPWTAQMKMLGNGVVPQQAKLALELLT